MRETRQITGAPPSHGASGRGRPHAPQSAVAVGVYRRGDRFGAHFRREKRKVHVGTFATMRGAIAIADAGKAVAS